MIQGFAPDSAGLGIYYKLRRFRDSLKIHVTSKITLDHVMNKRSFLRERFKDSGKGIRDSDFVADPGLDSV